MEICFIRIIKLDSGFLHTLYISLGNVAVTLQHTNTLSISELLLLQIVMAFCMLGPVHMSRASPANRADLSHENLYFSTT